MHLRAMSFAAIMTVALAFPASAVLITSGTQFDDGRSASADFTLLDADTIQIDITNTTNITLFDGSGASGILTQVGFTLDGVSIVGGSAIIGALSTSVDFSGGVFGAGTDLGNEWGYGNGGQGAIEDSVRVTIDPSGTSAISASWRTVWSSASARTSSRR